MSNSDHLMLRLSRLKCPEELEPKGEGLTFLFAKGGLGKYSSKVATHRVGAGDVLVFNRAAGAKLAVADGEGAFLFWSYSVCFENLLPLFAGGEISQLHKIVESYKPGKVYGAGSPVAKECQGLLGLVPGQFNLDHRGQLIRITATILSCEFKECLTQQRNGAASGDDHMVQVFEKLSASELITLSVGELAGRFSCSRRHLNRLFHQHFGVSVAALRMEMRLLKAVSLLRDVSAKVITVAEECGFNHLGLFNTCFKRRFGTSPGQWRKACLKAETRTTSKPENKTSCPLHYAGLCPMGARLEAEKAPSGAGPAGGPGSENGPEDDLKRRAVVFGAQPLADFKREWSTLMEGA